MTKSDYDALHFESKPSPARHPSFFGARGRLSGASYFGLHSDLAGDFLEIGCSTGRSLLLLAAEYPNCKFVGVDPSEKQIAIAKERANELELKNVEFFAEPLQSIDFSRRGFSTICAHGVFSWIEEEEALEVLKRASKLLDPSSGLLVLSANLEPHYSARGGLRAVLRQGDDSSLDSSARVAMARESLRTVRDSVIGKSDPVKLALHAELEHLLERSDEFFIHEVLSESTKAYYPDAILKVAKESGLRFLSLADLHSRLSRVKGETERDFDFVRSEVVDGLPFRHLLFCSEKQSKGRIFAQSVLEDLSFSSSLVPKDSHPNIVDDSSVAFVAASGKEQQFSCPILKSTFVYLHRTWPEACEFEELRSSVQQMSDNLELSSEQFIDKIVDALEQGLVETWLQPPATTHRVSSKPKLSPRAVKESSWSDWVTTLRFEYVPVGLFERQVFPLLNGEQTLEQITEELLAQVNEGSFGIKQEGEVIGDPAKQAEILGEQLEGLLSALKEHGLLES